MIDLRIEPSKTTPLAILNSDEGRIELRGKSTPENAINFYYPLIEKIKKLFASKRHIEVDVALFYFNTSSSKCLFDMFRELKKMEQRGAKVQINWYFEEDDEDMLETGEDYEDILGLTFNYIILEEIELQRVA